MARKRRWHLKFSPERLSQMAPAVFTANKHSPQVCLFSVLCLYSLFSLVTQLPMIIKWNFARWTLFIKTTACLLALFVKAGVDSNLKDALPWDCFWSAALCVVYTNFYPPISRARLNDRWACHACRHFDPAKPFCLQGDEVLRGCSQDVIYQHYLLPFEEISFDCLAFSQFKYIYFSYQLQCNQCQIPVL